MQHLTRHSLYVATEWPTFAQHHTAAFWQPHSRCSTYEAALTVFSHSSIDATTLTPLYSP